MQRSLKVRPRRVAAVRVVGFSESCIDLLSPRPPDLPRPIAAARPQSSARALATRDDMPRHGVSVCCYAHRWNASFAFRTCSAGFSVELLALSPLSRRLSWTSFRYGRHLIACLFCGGRCAEKATTLPQVSLFKLQSSSQGSEERGGEDALQLHEHEQEHGGRTFGLRHREIRAALVRAELLALDCSRRLARHSCEEMSSHVRLSILLCPIADACSPSLSSSRFKTLHPHLHLTPHTASRIGLARRQLAQPLDPRPSSRSAHSSRSPADTL
ncbi:uncharacterized protein RHTO_05980 [Rhodotorula toruloides NP11]|uniref:Uncharacterized protein n=1 Tax=Rhodotorula toruloides (strain NP11) TaxID=1130832 RepID=M7X461_RHOT1|nr:uncharacterized protein RHTO_05980 [Rhodotorula toruloides NP11]EMS18449.1 hypothetical protein RHTO_05980 [Rhodotorula toruloides NP11]